jgi:hypothetical protein
MPWHPLIVAALVLALTCTVRAVCKRLLSNR